MVIALALNILSVCMFTAYKYYFVLVVIYFVYDVFMVFFLPLITNVIQFSVSIWIYPQILIKFWPQFQEHKVNKAVGFGMQTSSYSLIDSTKVF